MLKLALCNNTVCSKLFSPCFCFLCFFVFFFPFLCFHPKIRAYSHFSIYVLALEIQIRLKVILFSLCVFSPHVLVFEVLKLELCKTTVISKLLFSLFLFLVFFCTFCFWCILCFVFPSQGSSVLSTSVYII